MGTTLTLDDDVAARLQAEWRKTVRPFKTVVNDRPSPTPLWRLTPKDLSAALVGH